MVRLEAEGDEFVGHVLSVQIGINRGREYLAALTFESVVFRLE